MTATGQATPRATRWPSVVAGVLTVSLLVTVDVTVGAVLGAGGRPLAADWRNLVAFALVAAAAVPAWRWFDESVHELASQHHEPYAAIQAISGPRGDAPTLAEAIARATHLDWVEVDLDGIESSGARRSGTTSVEIPIAYADQKLGVIRTAERRQGRGITRADHAVLSELAHQLALRVIAERAAVRAVESRNQVVTAREEERLRIRRDLHDGLAPSLASIQLQLKALQRRVHDQEDLRPTVDGLLADLEHTSSDLRRLVYGLRPPLLDELGIAGALEHQFAALDRPSLIIDVKTEALPAAVEVALLRIATEAVHNVVKHSRADRVEVTIVREGELIRLTVSDDGTGIPADARPGIGLAAMRERADEVGGSLSIGSHPGGGTAVVAEIRDAP
ncbi:sensor histidine kinase [Nocardioides marmorisolisilvae]|uniref:Oxygen sensor histidine kinase NreB n=1 Tax=Nocardioides marmorisolisilvae TaxID=1542737 RepID=A0A3N0DXA4_9ACTN|nr:sensor histidine kinase [Nocardioides marmorisolisilvae]RNL80191.1 sensor histidine kinase [Nocardioides marmorisolisilvae]